MATKLTLKQLAEDEGYSDVLDFLEEQCSDSVVRACCSEGCEVEPDGHCPHGNPSPLIAAGIL